MARKLVQPKVLVLVALVFLLTMTVAGQQGAKNGEWRVYGGDSGSTRYSPLDSINRDNVKNLKVAWRFSGKRRFQPAHNQGCR